jgi:hypothetical protein
MARGKQRSMSEVLLDDIESWRRFFSATGFSVGVETVEPWLHERNELAGHISRFVEGIVAALHRLGADVRRREILMGQDFDSRTVPPDVFLFSHHSIGQTPAVCRYKHSYLPGFFGCDPWGYSGFSRLARDPALLEAAWALPATDALRYARDLRLRQLSDNLSKFRQPPLSQPAPEPGYVLLALQMIGDTVMRLAPGEPLAFYRRVVHESVRAGRRCVIKRHPRCREPAVTAFLTEAVSHPLVTVHDNSVNQLLPAAERVIVINSSVGLESLIHGRPTLSFGDSEYACLTTRIPDCEAIAGAIRGPAWFDELRVARFLWFYFERYCVRADDDDALLHKVQECLSGLPARHGSSFVGDIGTGVWWD